MNPRRWPHLAMRPVLPTDVPLLAEIFRAAVEELTADDYSEVQQEAWASAADDAESFGAKLANELTLVATYGGAAVGFASLADNRRIDMLYVPPAASGAGAGAMLCDALEKLGGAPRQQGNYRGCQRLGARLFRKARLRGAKPQHGIGRRRMAGQYDYDKAAQRAGEALMKRPDTPFPRHWLYYLILKYAVIAGAVVVS